jgi:hypothetical protein
MQNTPTGRGSHLPSILRTLKDHPKSRSENMFLNVQILGPEESTKFSLPGRTPASNVDAMHSSESVVLLQYMYIYICTEYFICFSGDVFLTIGSDRFEVWDPSNQLRAEICLNLPQDLLKMAAYELETTLLRFYYLYSSVATSWRPTGFLFLTK